MYGISGHSARKTGSEWESGQPKFSKITKYVSFNNISVNRQSTPSPAEPFKQSAYSNNINFIMNVSLTMNRIMHKIINSVLTIAYILRINLGIATVQVK